MLKKLKTGLLSDTGIGILSFTGLIALSVIFYRERVCFIDSAFQFFKLVNFEKFNVELNRYTAYLPQIPLWLAIRSGLSLKALACVYSISYMVLYFALFLICRYIFNNKTSALVLLFALIICSAQTFYHIATETHLALAFSALYYAWLLYSIDKKISFLTDFFMQFTIILLTIFSHPVSIFTLLFVVIYIVVWKNTEIRNRGILTALACIPFMFVAKFLFLRIPGYESSFIQNLTGENIFMHIFLSESLKFFVFKSVTLYPVVIMMTLLLFFHYRKRKEQKKLIVLISFLAVYFIVTIITYNKGDAYVMLERSYMPLALFLSVPFLDDYLPQQKNNIKILLLVIILVKSFATIIYTGNKFHHRTNYLTEMMVRCEQKNISKAIVTPENLDTDIIDVPWALPFESLVLTSMEGESRTLVMEDNWTRDINLENSSAIFLGTSFWQVWQTDELNKKYFNLPEVNYRYLKETNK